MEGNKSEMFDPWAPQGDIKPLSMPFIKDPRRDMQSSEDYIATLEAKLARLKGKKCSSKDMIQSLSKAKQDHMEHIAPTTDYFSEETNTPSRLAQLQRRIVPQQALSADELQVLVENDELAKLMESISLEMEMEQLDVKKSAMGPDTKTAEASILSKETSPVKEDDDLANTNNTETACMDKSEPNDPVSPKEALQGEEKDVCEKNDTVTA